MPSELNVGTNETNETIETNITNKSEYNLLALKTGLCHHNGIGARIVMELRLSDGCAQVVLRLWPNPSPMSAKSQRE